LRWCAVVAVPSYDLGFRLLGVGIKIKLYQKSTILEDTFMTPDVPTPPEAVDLVGPLLQTLLFLGLFVAFLLTATYVIRRIGQVKWNKESTTSDIQIIERRVLSPKSALYLIEVKGKQILVGETAENLSHLAEIKKDYLN